MILIDTVYQKVLAIANKEQRGYITPQEFNLYAEQAQMDIFNQYFNDYDQYVRVPGNDSFYADRLDYLEQKIQQFEDLDVASDIANYNARGNGFALPEYIYRVSQISAGNGICEILNTRDFINIRTGSTLIKPTDEHPVANIRGGEGRATGARERGSFLRIIGFRQRPLTPTQVFFFRKPKKPNWSYIVVNDNALYDATNAVNFEIDAVETNLLIFKILQLAGINMGGDLYGVAVQEEVKKTQQQKQ